MSIQNAIEQKLQAAFSPMHLEVINESDNHDVPRGSESHFKLVVVSKDFEGMPLITRQRQVNKLLEAELKGGVHALTMHTLTPEDWFNKGGTVPQSPECLGGSKRS